VLLLFLRHNQKIQVVPAQYYIILGNNSMKSDD
jgi:hypothetical protein